MPDRPDADVWVPERSVVVLTAEAKALLDDYGYSVGGDGRVRVVGDE